MATHSPVLALRCVKLESNTGMELLIQGRFIHNVSEVEAKNLTEESLLEGLLTNAAHVSDTLRKLKVEMPGAGISQRVLELLEQRKTVEREIQV